jgi:cytoskeletal protein CcmA (bactofilin family)
MSMRSIDSPLFNSQRPDPREEQAESISILDRFSNFDGTFHSSRDLRIEGQAKGTIECQGTLYIAQGATIDAKVEAENISVAGDLDGDITCRGRLQILPSGRVRGTIHTATIVIHEGAFYEGSLEMATPERQVGSTTRRTRPGLSSGTAAAVASTSGSAGVATQEAGGEETRHEPRTEQRIEQPASPSTGGGNTFIRRLGGQETTWDGNSGNDDERGS